MHAMEWNGMQCDVVADSEQQQMRNQLDDEEWGNPRRAEAEAGAGAGELITLLRGWDGMLPPSRQQNTTSTSTST
ncbi:GM22958 [Drosophila sechellia]|uniref:GM22958 n=1 Tax=Drosophila sechellia TaxID=7238 RepID=B4I749_DROSE|nr:GM22958 [Drosophila sechellia]